MFTNVYISLESINNNKTTKHMKTFNALLTILTVLIMCTGIFFAMFQQFEFMLLSLSLSFFTSLFIK